MQIQRSVGIRVPPVLVMGLSVLLAAGCARRFKLTPDELVSLDERVTSYERRLAVDPQAAKAEVFVYTHRRFIVKYEQNTEKSVEVGRTVDMALMSERPLIFILRSRAGQIVARDESNGVPRLWVSFSSECNIMDCAYGFVRTEDNLHKLAYVPAREGFALQAVYYRHERPGRIMKKMKIRTNGEANHVYVLKRKRRVKTVYLDVKKRIRRDEYRTIEVPDGR